MPRKLHVNEKAEAARERKEAVQQDKANRKAAANEDAKWADEGTTAAEKRAAERAAKQQQRDEQARQKREARAADEAAIESVKLAASARKQQKEIRLETGEEAPRRVTAFELQQRAEAAAAAAAEREAAERRRMQERLLTNVDHLAAGNINQARKAQLEQDAAKFGAGNVHVATTGGIESAIKAMTLAAGGAQAAAATAVDRNPERRRKAAFKLYEEEQMPVLKAFNPTLKFSQLKEMLFEQWQKAPENPVNQATAAAAAAGK